MEPHAPNSPAATSATFSPQLDQQLMAIVRHDLRSPLLNLSMVAKLLSQGGSSAEAQVDLSELLVEATQRLDRMTRDLIDFTLARLGHALTLQPSSTQLHSLLRTAIEQLEPAFPNRPFELLGEDVYAVLDPTRTLQLLQNLLQHALRFGKPRSVVRISTSQTEGSVRIEVQVEGAVLTPEKQANLFLEFAEGEHEADRNAGIGLYLVRVIARAHGGTANVVSTEEDGTRFTVCLPYHPPSAEPSTP